MIMIKKYLKKYIYIYIYIIIYIYTNHKSFKNENLKKVIKKIPKKRNISPEKKQKVIDNLRSIMIIL